MIDAQATGEGFGLLRINSVYDFDGQDDSEFDGVEDIDVGIAALADPANAAYPLRRARFIRLVKPVPLPDPDNDNFDIDRLVFGVSPGQGLREIIGYAPVEPDGSVTVKVPANTPFAISLLDERGRRISGRERHDVWLQLAEGEIRNCAGCHTSNSQLPHGRIDSQPTPANSGAQSIAVGTGTGIGFPNTRVDRDDYPAEFLDGGSIGQTMAEIYDLQRPLANKDETARELFLTDWQYTDEWADTVNGQTPDPALDYSYGVGWTSYPTVNNSQAPYVNRIVVNYIDHIQPIWERSRVMLSGGVQVKIDPLDAMSADADNCLACHRSNPDDNDAAEVAIPPGQLDLGRHVDDTYYRSYRELFFTDTERWLDAGATVTDRIRACTEDQDDGMGGTVTVAVPDPSPPNVTPALRSAGANNSNAFFNCFEGGVNCGAFNQQATPPAGCVEDGTVVIDPILYNHDGWLTDGELRLISEWLDIGAQYYNNPFHPDLTP